MKEVPNIISIKDLLYIEDMLNWNFVMNKKVYAYLECVEDEKVIELLTKIKKMHFIAGKRVFTFLKKYHLEDREYHGLENLILT